MRGRYAAAYVRAQHEGSYSGMWWRGGAVHVVVCRDERAAVCTWCMWWCVHVVVCACGGVCMCAQGGACRCERARSFYFCV